MNHDRSGTNFKNMIGELESSIISAHKKYFSGNSESPGTSPEHANLYGIVMRYFTGESA